MTDSLKDLNRPDMPWAGVTDCHARREKKIAHLISKLVVPEPRTAPFLSATTLTS